MYLFIELRIHAALFLPSQLDMKNPHKRFYGHSLKKGRNDIPPEHSLEILYITSLKSRNLSLKLNGLRCKRYSTSLYLEENREKNDHYRGCDKHILHRKMILGE